MSRYGILLGAAAITGALVTSGAAFAGDASTASPFEFEGGIRYWYSTGTSAKNLYDGTGSLLISRLTYGGLDSHAGELFFRADHKATGIFLKGNLGLGIVDQGHLTDEDFEPVTSPYSSTLSPQHSGDIGYLTADVGYDFIRKPTYRLGAFVGYNLYRENLEAFGCTQQGGNPGICVPSIPSSVAVIKQDNTWHSLRLGLSGQTELSDRFTLKGDAAYIYSYLDGYDHHLLRPSINPIPENGSGSGVQLEAVLDYKLTDMAHLGIGARYWKFTSDGTAHFEQTPGGGYPQVEHWSTDRYGVFAQLSFKLN